MQHVQKLEKSLIQQHVHLAKKITLLQRQKRQQMQQDISMANQHMNGQKTIQHVMQSLSVKRVTILRQKNVR